MSYIYKNYMLIGDVLYKIGIDDNKHLLWKFGGVPAIDADNVWDKYKMMIKKIVIKTKKGRSFRISADVFDKNKKEINLGFGRQYYVEKDLWDFKDFPKKDIPNLDEEEKQIQRIADLYNGKII